MVNPREINPICFAFGSFDRRYLIVHTIKSGEKRILTRYTPSCVPMLTERGFSFIFFPQVGQKKAVSPTGEEQNGQTIGATGMVSTFPS